MKTNNDLSVCFEEISSSESEAISGGFLVLTLIGGLAGICAIAYYTGYGVGKIMCD